MQPSTPAKDQRPGLPASLRASMRAALLLAASFSALRLLLQFTLTLWTAHLGYGYFRDEFYFLACGRHLAWGYVDQGPAVAIQGRLATALFGDSVFGIRVLSAVAGALTVGLGGLLTWAMGGRRSAQVLTMVGLLLLPVLLAVDGFLSITSFEPVFWMGTILALLLLERGAPARNCWLAVGACAGLGLLNKPSMLFFLAALLAALVLTPERRLLRSRWFGVACVLSCVLVTPFLLWQAQHNWPTWEFLQNAKHGKDQVLAPAAFLGAQISQLNPFSALLWLPGLFALVRGRSIHGLRWMGLTYLLFLPLMFALRAKDYYLAPIYPMLFAAGGVAWEHAFASRRAIAEQRFFAFPLLEGALIASGLLILPMTSPVMRPDTWVRYTHALHLTARESERARTGILPQFFADRFGWVQLAQIVDTAYRSLPAAQREHVCIFTENYGEASSLEFLGRRLDPELPTVISGHNNYWLWGMRGCSGDPILAVVHDSPAELHTKYDSVIDMGQETDPLAMPYEHKHVYLLQHRRADAPVAWPAEKNFI